MLDGQETVEIAWGELRWEGARQHAGRRGSFAGRERDSMLDGQENVEIACGEFPRTSIPPYLRNSSLFKEFLLKIPP